MPLEKEDNLGEIVDIKSPTTQTKLEVNWVILELLEEWNNTSESHIYKVTIGEKNKPNVYIYEDSNGNFWIENYYCYSVNEAKQIIEILNNIRG